MKLLIIALCIVSATAFTKRCKTADDCEEGECCVNYVLVSFLGGHCQKLREEGESCTPLIRESDQTPDMYHFQCPCKDGLTCEATHNLKIGDLVIRHKPECVVPGQLTTVFEELTPEPTIGEPEAE